MGEKKFQPRRLLIPPPPLQIKCTVQIGPKSIEFLVTIDSTRARWILYLDIYLWYQPDTGTEVPHCQEEVTSGQVRFLHFYNFYK